MKKRRVIGSLTKKRRVIGSLCTFRETMHKKAQQQRESNRHFFLVSHESAGFCQHLRHSQRNLVLFVTPIIPAKIFAYDYHLKSKFKAPFVVIFHYSISSQNAKLR